MSQLAAVADLIRSTRPTRSFTLVGIGGHGASGKTTLARALRDELASEPEAEPVTTVQIVATDSFWNGTQFALDDLRRDVVEVLRRGAAATYRAWDWSAGAPGSCHAVLPTGIVIIEGVCALHTMFRPDLDVRIWIDAPPDVRLERGVARDGEESRARWTDVWMPNEAAYVARDQPTLCAQIVVDGTAPL